jgi:hypothetical protein
VREIKTRASAFVHSEFVHVNRASNVDALFVWLVAGG